MSIDYLPPILVPIIGIFLPFIVIASIFVYIEKESVN